MLCTPPAEYAGPTLPGRLSDAVGARQMHVADVGLQACTETYALVWLAGLVALQASPASYERSVSAAFAAGERAMRFVGVLVVLAPVAGVAREQGGRGHGRAIGC